MEVFMRLPIMLFPLLIVLISNLCFGMEQPEYLPETIECEIGQKDYSETQTACTAMALSSIAYLIHRPIDTIAPIDLFNIINAGRNFYTKINADGFLACDEALINQFNEGEEEYTLIPADIGVGNSSAHEGKNCIADKLSKEEATSGILSTEEFITILENSNRSVGAVWTLGLASYAIIAKDGYYLFFDSHHNGNSTKGGSHLIIFETSKSIINFLTSIHKNKPFAVTFVYPGQPEIQEIIKSKSKVLETEQINPLQKKTCKKKVETTKSWKKYLIGGTFIGLGILGIIGIKKIVKKGYSHD